MTSSYISAHRIYQPDLTDDEIRIIVWKLLNKHFINIKPELHSSLGIMADIAFEHEFNKKRNPKKKVIKMSKSNYIDDFFKNGLLQIGNFRYYRKYDNPEIGDSYEGSCLLVGRNKAGTTFTDITSGLNHYIFCAYNDKPDIKAIKKFGYDDYFEILDVKAFSNAISKVLKSKSSYYSKCIYKEHRALVSNPDASFNINIISGEIRKVANEIQYFLKSKKFEHQNEFRFTWEIEHDIEEPIIIKCKEAVQFCKRK